MDLEWFQGLLSEITGKPKHSPIPIDLAPPLPPSLPNSTSYEETLTAALHLSNTDEDVYVLILMLPHRYFTQLCHMTLQPE